MCSGFIAQRCGVLKTCVEAGPQFSCQHYGDRCMTCVDAAPIQGGASVHGILAYNEHGQFVGLMVKREGDSGLLPFDVITHVDGVSADLFFEKYDPKARDAELLLTVMREASDKSLVMLEVAL